MVATLSEFYSPPRDPQLPDLATPLNIYPSLPPSVRSAGMPLDWPCNFDRLDSNQLSVTCRSFVARCGWLPLAKECRLVTARRPGWPQWSFLSVLSRLTHLGSPYTISNTKALKWKIMQRGFVLSAGVAWRGPRVPGGVAGLKLPLEIAQDQGHVCKIYLTLLKKYHNLLCHTLKIYIPHTKTKRSFIKQCSHPIASLRRYRLQWP